METRKKRGFKKVNCRSDEIFPDVSICCLALLSQTREWEFWVSIWNWIWTKSSRSSTVLKWIPSSKLVTLFCQRRSNNPWSSFRPISQLTLNISKQFLHYASFKTEKQVQRYEVPTLCTNNKWKNTRENSKKFYTYYCIFALWGFTLSNLFLEKMCENQQSDVSLRENFRHESHDTWEHFIKNAYLD